MPITDWKSGDKVHIRWQGNSGTIYDWECILVSMNYDVRSHQNVLAVKQGNDRHSFVTNVPTGMIISMESAEDWDLGV